MSFHQYWNRYKKEEFKELQDKSQNRIGMSKREDENEIR
jgi:hypothetical protein